ncbi:putative secreted protein (Por secretion system target) [Mariniflexile fucanivorans]|uniref:Putative secreted protein (Por secretion system target) n=1 Tax=Mariniflexile fucanivorans TaxID=264023 RepID=A0A4R1RNX6_9FLAO|nr:T9SS type A sorting domain-containing protein [Mariniflexile fucanivorans]TCL67879.1 putative secreted protein (Por secretion system target) [Mariniflexile fucanivorans]
MKKITQVSMLFVALFFMNVNLNAQSADFEFLFDTDGDTEGFIGGTVAQGALKFDYGSNVKRFDYAPTTGTSPLRLDKTNFPYLAMQLSAVPNTRHYVFIDVDGIGQGWYLDKGNPITDPDLIAQNIIFYDMAGENFDLDNNNATPLVGLDDSGAKVIDRLLFNFYDDSGVTSVYVGWIKTFASVQAIKDYAAANPFTLGVNDVANKSLTKVISGENKIDIVKCELNAKVQVFDLLGKQVHSSVAKSTNLSIPFFNKGIYVVKISGEASVLTKKIILN